MAEKIKTRMRIARIYSSDAVDIKDEATAKAAVWVAEPLTLAEDELIIAESEATVEEIKSHELDTPVDIDIDPGSTEAGGSFIEMTKQQLANLIGGKATATAFSRALGKKRIDKALLFTLKDGGAIVMPRAIGYALLNINLGRTGGRFKVPFKFYPTVRDGAETDFIMIDEFEAPVVVAPAMAPMSVQVTTETTTEAPTEGKKTSK